MSWSLGINIMLNSDKMFEFFIENYKLDIKGNLSALLNLSIDDVKDFSSRSTSFSRTIVLPGNSTNNKLFGHIFDISINNTYDDTLANVGYNFNAAKSAKAIIFQDNIQEFSGVLRLLEIIVDRDHIEYEVSVFGHLNSLNSALVGALIEDLDFSAYDEAYTETNIIASWDNPGGSGLYYPLIDYGTYSTNKKDWQLGTFRPAIYVKEIIDKMFSNAGFRYESALFDTDRFKRLIVPNNRKALYSDIKNLLNVTSNTPQVITNNPGGVYDPFADASMDLAFATQVIIKDFTASIDDQEFTYGGSTLKVDITLNLNITYKSVTEDVSIFLFKNFPGVIGSGILAATPTYQSETISISASNLDLNNLDVLSAWIGYPGIVSPDYYIRVDSCELIVNLTAAQTATLGYGETVNVNFNLPKNIRQIDFLVSIVKLWNLYVTEDQFDDRLIYIKPFVNFYNTALSDVVDWTYKLNRNKPTRIRPMSEINAKIYEFKYKSDSDYYNELYKKRYGVDYGNHIYDTEFEFEQKTDSFELIFSPTPLVGFAGEDKLYSTIYKKNNDVEENVDSNIRILQTKKVTGVASWNILDDATVLASPTEYGYAGHYDDPDSPTNDLNFGALAEVFFTLVAGDLSNTQFNAYWSQYMAEITDKNSKLVTANFYLKPSDIFNLDYSKYIMVDGVIFRLNKIIDYNLVIPDDCKVELLKSIFSGITSGGGTTTVCQAVITLSPAQVADTGGSITVDGIVLNSLAGVVTLVWDASMKASFITWPVIWAYYNGAKQPVFPVLNDNDNPTEVTIDLGIIPDNNAHIILPCIDSAKVLTLTAAQITSSGPIIVEGISLSATAGVVSLYWLGDQISQYGAHPVIFVYYDGQIQPVFASVDNNDSPGVITLDLGAIPSGDAHFIIMRSFTFTVIELSPAEVASCNIITNGISVTSNDGVISVTMNAELLALHGEFPFVGCYYDNAFRSLSPSINDNDNPTILTLDLGAIPSGKLFLILV